SSALLPPRPVPAHAARVLRLALPGPVVRGHALQVSREHTPGHLDRALSASARRAAPGRCAGLGRRLLRFAADAGLEQRSATRAASAAGAHGAKAAAA